MQKFSARWIDKSRGAPEVSLASLTTARTTMDEGVLQLWHGVLFRQRPDLSFEWISPRIQEWTGLEPHRALEAVHPADRPRLAEAQTTLRLRHVRTGRITWVEQRRHAIANGHEGYWENITEYMRLKHQLAQAQWDGTLGMATNKLLHDFNNLLTGVLSLSDAYLTTIQPDNPAREGFKVLNQQARQAAEIVQNIGRLFRDVPGRRSYENLSDVAASAGEMLRRVLPRHTSVKVQAHGESIPVYLDAAELKQAIVSLAVAGASESIVLETRSPASLQISLGRASLPENQASHARRFAQRNHATFIAAKSSFTFQFSPADYSEADKEAARPRSILIAGRESKTLFEIADFLRRNSYEVVVGGEDWLELLRSPDYHFDGIWMRNEDAQFVERLRQDFPALKRVVSIAVAPDQILAELREALKP